MLLMSSSGFDPGCVKTCTGKECAELFSLLASPDSGRQRYWFSNRRNQDGISTRKFCVGVFTQPGPIAVLHRASMRFVQTRDSQAQSRRAGETSTASPRVSRALHQQVSEFGQADEGISECWTIC